MCNFPHPWPLSSKTNPIHSVFSNCVWVLQAGLLRVLPCNLHAAGAQEMLLVHRPHLAVCPPTSLLLLHLSLRHLPISRVSGYLRWARCPARCGKMARPCPPAIHSTVGRARQVARQTTVCVEGSAGSLCQAAMGTEGRACEHTDESSS